MAKAKKVKKAKPAAKKTAVKKASVKKAATKKPTARLSKAATKNPAKRAAAANGNGLPKPSNKPQGMDGKALDGVKILDFTHVQSGRPARSCWAIWARTASRSNARVLATSRAPNSAT